MENRCDGHPEISSKKGITSLRGQKKARMLRQGIFITLPRGRTTPELKSLMKQGLFEKPLGTILWGKRPLIYISVNNLSLLGLLEM